MQWNEQGKEEQQLQDGESLKVKVIKRRVNNGQRPSGMKEEYIQSQDPEWNVALRRKRTRRRTKKKKKKEFNGISEKYRWNFPSHLLYCYIHQHYTSTNAAQWHRVASASSDILHSSKTADKQQYNGAIHTAGHLQTNSSTVGQYILQVTCRLQEALHLTEQQQ